MGSCFSFHILMLERINSTSENSPRMNLCRFTALSVPKWSWRVRHELTASTRTPSQSNTTHVVFGISLPADMTLMLLKTTFLERLRSRFDGNTDRSQKKKGAEGRGPLSETPCVRAVLCLQRDSHPITGMRETKRRGVCPSSMHPFVRYDYAQALRLYDKPLQERKSAPSPTFGA